MFVCIHNNNNDIYEQVYKRMGSFSIVEVEENKIIFMRTGTEAEEEGDGEREEKEGEEEEEKQ